VGFRNGHPPFASPKTEGEHLALGASHCDDARRNLIRAMHHLDEIGGGKVWQHLVMAVSALDDARALLTREGARRALGKEAVMPRYSSTAAEHAAFIQSQAAGRSRWVWFALLALGILTVAIVYAILSVSVHGELLAPRYHRIHRHA